MAFRLCVNYVTKRVSLLNVQKLERLQQSNSFFTSTWKSLPVKKIALAVCCLGVGGGTYGYLQAMPDRSNRNVPSALIEMADSYVTTAPDIKPSRQISGPAKDLGLNLTLYQYQTCPFCCKVRAFLDYYGLPYDVVEVHPVKKQQLKFSKYKKVPVLIANDPKVDLKLQLTDSSVIISILGTYFLNMHDGLKEVLKYYAPVKYTNDEGKEVTEVMNRFFLMYGENALSQKMEEIRTERKWRKWVDEEFVHVLSPNIYRTREEAVQAFNYFSEAGEWEKHFTKFERLSAIYFGATAMYFIGRRLKKKYALKEDVRQSLYDAGRHWMKGIGKSTYMGGNSPNLADLAIYGCLSSIEGCAAFKDLLENTNIGPWYYSMKEAVNNHEGFRQIDFQKLKSADVK